MWATGENTTPAESAPVPRGCSHVVFDDRKNRMVAFGGFNGRWLSDVIVLDIARSVPCCSLLLSLSFFVRLMVTPFVFHFFFLSFFVASSLSSKTSKDLLEEYQLSSKEVDIVTRKLTNRKIEAPAAEEGEEEPEAKCPASDVANIFFSGGKKIFSVNMTPEEAEEVADAVVGLFAGQQFDPATVRFFC